MPITNTIKICSYLVAGKWKAFYTQRRIPGPIIITNPILSSAPTNTSASHYGLILIQPGSLIKYIVRGAPWFSSTQPAPHTPTETWDSRVPSSQVL